MWPRCWHGAFLLPRRAVSRRTALARHLLKRNLDAAVTLRTRAEDAPIPLVDSHVVDARLAAFHQAVRLSPLGWWEFGDGAEVGGDVQAVSVPVLGWAIA